MVDGTRARQEERRVNKRPKFVEGDAPSSPCLRNPTEPIRLQKIAKSAKLVAVKRAINQRAVELRPLDDVRREIEEAAKSAVGSAARVTPRKAPAYKVELQFKETVIPEIAANLPGIERPSPATVAFAAETMPKAYTLIRLLYRYINPD